MMGWVLVRDSIRWNSTTLNDAVLVCVPWIWGMVSAMNRKARHLCRPYYSQYIVDFRSRRSSSILLLRSIHSVSHRVGASCIAVQKLVVEFSISLKGIAHREWYFDSYTFNARIANSMDSSDALLEPSRASTALESARSHACSTLYELSGSERNKDDSG